MLRLDDAALIVVDFQDALLPKIHDSDQVVGKACKMIRFARELAVPVVWTEQYPKGLGKTDPRVAGLLEDLTPLEKLSFGCFGAAGFPEAVDATGARQLVVVGVEAHVCVMQTVLAALDQGLEVYVARDAVGSRDPLDREAGLARMQAHGAELVTVEMALFEMLRAAGTPEFKRVLPIIK